MRMLGITIGIIVIVFLLSGGWDWLTCERGSIDGEFVKGETEGFGDLCGQYPFTSLWIKNHSVDGEIWSAGNCFHFGNQIDYLDDLKQGVEYRFFYHEEWRPSDADAGSRIYYYVLDGYEKL